MYRTTKYPVNCYIPTKIENAHDLHSRLNKIKFDEITKDFDYHFKNCYVTNFDLIHHECRGDKLNHSRKFYQTIFYNQMKKNLSEKDQEGFVASAIKAEREDLNFEKKVIDEHFKKVSLERNLEKKGIFLSAMRKKCYSKKTEDCKSIKF